MGQLEKYGLYVLCLLIFLILGVTLWGSGEVGSRAGGERMTPKHLNANVGDSGAGVADGSGVRPVVEPPTREGTAPRIDFSALMRPAVPPGKKDSDKPGPAKIDPKIDPKADPKKGLEATPPSPPSSQARPAHKIQSGDNYESIALSHFGTRALGAEIARLNPAQDPRKLQLGKELVLPTAAEVEQFQARQAGSQKGASPSTNGPSTNSPSNNSGAAAAAGGTHTIVRGDTLDGIAIKVLGSRKYTAGIQELNPGLDATNLKVGTTIRLPTK